jgi:nucleotide sugar dehydrogenase
MKVVVVGVGKVGSGLIDHLVSLGHSVTALDTNQNALTAFTCSHGEACEVVCTIDPNEAYRAADAAVLIVPTPEDGDRLSSKYVQGAGEQARALLPKGAPIFIASTLDPRDANELCGSIDAIYTPVFIRLGSVFEDLQNQKYLLVGTFDKERVGDAARLWKWHFGSRTGMLWYADPCTVACAKMAINATLSSRIAWANDIAERAKAFGAEPGLVLQMVSEDPRVGTGYFKSGMPPGGPCLPRDLDVWTSVPGNGLAEAVLICHRAARNRVIAKILEDLASKPVRSILVVGLTYKEGGLDWTNSLGMEILKELKGTEYKVYAYDREGTPASMVEKFGATKVEGNAPFNSFDAIVVGFPGYPEAMAKQAKDNSRGLLVVNPWR